jgi:hypothetical protein
MSGSLLDEVADKRIPGRVVADARPEFDLSAETRDCNRSCCGHAGRRLNRGHWQDLGAVPRYNVHLEDGVPECASQADDGLGFHPALLANRGSAACNCGVGFPITPAGARARAHS